MSIYDDIRALMAEAEGEHGEIDRKFEARLNQLLARGRGSELSRPHPSETPPGDAQVDVPPELPAPNGPPRVPKQTIADEMREIFADGTPHKLANLARDTGHVRGSVYAALSRLVEKNEIVALGDGVYQLKTAEGAPSDLLS